MGVGVGGGGDVWGEGGMCGGRGGCVGGGGDVWGELRVGGGGEGRCVCGGGGVYLNN